MLLTSVSPQYSTTAQCLKLCFGDFFLLDYLNNFPTSPDQDKSYLGGETYEEVCRQSEVKRE